MQEYKYKDNVLVFNPNGKPRYTINGKAAMGVTTVLSSINKPALLPWAAKSAYEHCKELNNDQIQEVLTTKKYAHLTKSGAAMDKGTLAHEWVENYNKAKIANLSFDVNTIPEEVRVIVTPYINWVEGLCEIKTKSHKWDKNSIEIAPKPGSCKILRAEQSVFSIKYWYAGTFDIILEIDGKKYIADFKTSSGIYGREYFYQQSAYRNATEELGWGTDIVGSIVIRSGKEGNDLEVKVSEAYEADFKCFRAALILYKEGFVEDNLE